MFKVRFDLAAATALVAMIRGAEPAFPSNHQFLPKPPHVRDATPRQQRARENQRNQLANRKRRAELRDSDETARQAVIAKFTNWQRNQWATAKYPQDLERLRKFAAMERRAS